MTGDAASCLAHW